MSVCLCVCKAILICIQTDSWPSEVPFLAVLKLQTSTNCGIKTFQVPQNVAQLFINFLRTARRTYFPATLKQLQTSHFQSSVNPTNFSIFEAALPYFKLIVTNILCASSKSRRGEDGFPLLKRLIKLLS